MKLTQVLAGLALVLGLASTARAQCLTPDGLDPVLPPCAPSFLTALNKPFSQKATGICWRQCGIDATANYFATWSPLYPSFGTPGAIDCGWFTVRVQLTQGSNVRWAGSLNAHYARTWNEVGPGGQFQVWRYLLNGDMRPLNAAAGPCGVPPCAIPAFNRRVRFTGYIDYALDCATNQVRKAWMLTHACDAIDHDAGFPRAGVFHPDRYYTFVGPSASFVPGLGVGTESGAGALESVRRWDVSTSTAGMTRATCMHDEPLATAVFNPWGQSCLCSAGAPMWYEADLVGIGMGGTNFQTPPGQPDFKSVTIGSWTNPNNFPGVEEVRWNASKLLYSDVCLPPPPMLEYFYGVTTHGGFTAFNIDASGTVILLPSMFIDQCSSKLFPIGGPVSVRNIPARSDHVLNLNL